MVRTPLPSLPTGTVTFLFTDIEGSTNHLQALGDGYLTVLEQHNTAVEDAVVASGGVVVTTEGDSFFAVFSSAQDALAAAASAQTALSRGQWPEGHTIRVRMGLHTGLGTLGGADYVGLDLHRAARIASAAHGGQTVLSEATAVLTERSLPDSSTLRDLGKHRLKDLTSPETIYQLDVDGLPTEFPPLRTLDAVPNNLPLQVTTFVGREDVLRQARHLLAGTRLLTLIGPGGTGKTRLSLQLAGEMAEDFDDGVFFVSLSTLSDPSLVPSEILEAMGIAASTGEQSPAERLVEQLAGKNLFLVLDNFEQILEAAPVVASVIRASAALKVVVTSRAPLRISGEQEMPVPPLGLAGGAVSDLAGLAGVEAVHLFLERAMAVRPDFELTAENAADVVELVRRLDGLPLAIELAASRVRLLPVTSILERFDVRLLSGGAVDLPERQQTIWGAIGWSYDLLSTRARTLFSTLSIFVGGARLEEIEAVCAAPEGSLLETLEELVDNSLIFHTGGSSGPRFRMLHVIQEYASERLEESGRALEVRGRHADAYLRLVEEAAPRLVKRERKQWLDLLADDHDNLRAALDRAVAAAKPDLAMRLAFSSWRLWQARGHLHEARARLEEIVAMEGGEPANRAMALEALGGVRWWQGDLLDCLTAYRDALDLQRTIGDQRQIANAAYNTALGYGFAEIDSSMAHTLLDEAESIYTELGDLAGLGDVAWGRANTVAYVEGDLAGGLLLLEQAAEYYRRAGNEFGLGWALYEIGDTSYKAGDFDASRRYLSQGLELFANHADVSAVVLFLSSFAGLAKEMGDLPRAVQLAGAFHHLRVISGTDLVTARLNVIEGLEQSTLEAMRGNLLDDYRRGQSMSFDEAVAYALSG